MCTNVGGATGRAGSASGISSELIAEANRRSFSGNVGSAVNKTFADNVQELIRLANTNTKGGKMASETELNTSIGEMKNIAESVLRSNINLSSARKRINDYFRDTRKKWTDRTLSQTRRRGSGDSSTY